MWISLFFPCFFYGVVTRKKGIVQDLIFKQSRRIRHTAARRIFCYIAMLPGFTTRETRVPPGIQQAAVSNAARKEMRILKDEEFGNSVIFDTVPKFPVPKFQVVIQKQPTPSVSINRLPVL